MHVDIMTTKKFNVGDKIQVITNGNKITCVVIEVKELSEGTYKITYKEVDTNDVGNKRVYLG